MTQFSQEVWNNPIFSADIEGELPNWGRTTVLKNSQPLPAHEALATVLPDFSRQIDLAKKHTESEICSLVQSFEQIVNRLPNGKDTKPVNASFQFEGMYQAHLEQLRRSQQSLSESASTIKNKFDRIAKFSKELTQIGEHSNMLAVETYKILQEGNTGQAAPANIPTKLIFRSMETMQIGADLNKLLVELGQDIDDVFQQANEMSEAQNSTLSMVEKRLHLLSRQFNYIAAEEKAISDEEIREIRDEINNILVSFQFQDKVCQIMDSVNKSIQSIMHYVNESTDSSSQDQQLSIEKLKSLIEASYISEEQYEEEKNKGGDTYFF